MLFDLLFDPVADVDVLADDVDGEEVRVRLRPDDGHFHGDQVDGADDVGRGVHPVEYVTWTRTQSVD